MEWNLNTQKTLIRVIRVFLFDGSRGADEWHDCDRTLFLTPLIAALLRCDIIRVRTLNYTISGVFRWCGCENRAKNHNETPIRRRAVACMESRTRGDRAVDQLLQLIRERGYSAGEKLPNEYELSAQLGVGRNTIREAVRALVSRNILDIRQGAGTFISPKKGVADDPLGFSLMGDRRKLVEDLLQIRYIIEPQIAALAAQNRTEQNIVILGRLCDEGETLIRKRCDFMQKDIEFHSQLAACSRNMVISNLVPVICEGIAIFAATVSEPEFEQTAKSHREIFEAVRERRAADAQQAMVFHLLYNRNRFITEQE
jgi:DNA-binding FadR family transcriptional regulator